MTKPCTQLKISEISKAKWAEHKFNQRKIMAKAGRHDLAVHYYRGLWSFIDPSTDKPLVESLDDNRAIEWLASFSESEETDVLDRADPSRGGYFSGR